MQYQYWAHSKSGDVFAVQIDNGRVTRAVGPLSYQDRAQIGDDGMPTGELIDAGEYDYTGWDAIDTGEMIAKDEAEDPSRWGLATFTGHAPSAQYNS